MNSHLTAQEAASEIVALIHSKPASPFPDEIREIIDRIEPERIAYSCQPCSCSGKAIDGHTHWWLPHREADASVLLEDWRKRESEHLAAVKEAEDDEVQPLIDAFLEYSEELWWKPIRSWRDVRLRLEISKHWNAPLGVDEREFPLWVLDNQEALTPRERAMAHLALAVHQYNSMVDLGEVKVASRTVAVWGGRDEAIANDRAVWRERATEAEIALKRADLKPGDPRRPALEAVSATALERQGEFERAIWARPASGIADIQLLAELLTYQLWPAHTPEEIRAFLDQDEPKCVVEAATIALLKAIRDVIGSIEPLSAEDEPA